MNRFQLFAFMIFFALIGCAAPRIVDNPSTAYDSLGMIEEKASLERRYMKVLTFGLVRKHSYRSLTKKLSHRLEEMARDKYGADAVNNIQYWPAPDSDALVDYLYARGEMIRFKKFGESTAAA